MTNALYDDSIRPPEEAYWNTEEDARYGDHSPNSPNPIAAYHNREGSQ